VIRIALLVSSLALATVAAPAKANQAGPAMPRQTHDRLPSEKMAVLVAGPIRSAEEDGLPHAERAFDRLLEKARRRHGSASVREADLLMAFGVQLFVRGGELDREDMRKLSAAYLLRAVEATKRAYGPVHPETALALHSYADLLLELQQADPPDDAVAALANALPVRQVTLNVGNAEAFAAIEAALAEALSIRRATLGTDNAETLAAMRALARIKAAQFRTAGKLDEAAELFRQAIEISTRFATPEGYLKPASLRLALVRAYVKAGRVDDALREARIAADAAREQEESEESPCSFEGPEAMGIVAELEVERPAEAEKMRQLLVPAPSCLERLMEQLKEAPGPD
jgi:tetratricopeptide (TPR) repeat protein